MKPAIRNGFLDPLKNVALDYVLDTRAQHNPVQVAYFGEPYDGIPAGRCFHKNANGQAELGCAGFKVPMFSFEPSNKPQSFKSTGNVATATTTVATTSVARDATRFLVGLEQYEIRTTEFDASLNYAINDPLIAPVVSGASQAVSAAGKLTKTGAVYGATTIVGVVSQPFTAASPTKMHSKAVLCLYTCFLPAVAGLPNGLAEPTWQA